MDIWAFWSSLSTTDKLALLGLLVAIFTGTIIQIFAKDIRDLILEKIFGKARISCSVIIIILIMIFIVIFAPDIRNFIFPYTPTLLPTTVEATITANAQWKSQIQVKVFDGVEMVLVPRGCFDMGNDPDAYDWPRGILTRGVRSGGNQCFAPFWLDKTEVSNAQFDALDGVADQPSISPNLNDPRENIDWFEASNFCTERGGRLPTEAEWEYAARGPDGLFYPWGNQFVPENVVYYILNAPIGSAEVGSKPSGASWVGALGLSGNVGEWVNNNYQPYPFNNPPGSGTDFQRSRRGGSYKNDDHGVRAASRNRSLPIERFSDIGFRCLLPYAEP